MDRCRALSQKIMCKTSDPVAQRIHRENAERILLASFVAVLMGNPGKQVRYASPRDIGQVLSIALAVQEAEKQERFNESFHAKFYNSDCQRGHPVGCARITIGLGAHLTCQCSITCVVSATNLRIALASHQHQPPGKYRRKLQSVIECEGPGHFAKIVPYQIKEKPQSFTHTLKREPERMFEAFEFPGEKVTPK